MTRSALSLSTMAPMPDDHSIATGAIPICRKQHIPLLLHTATKHPIIARMQRQHLAAPRMPGDLATVDEHTRGLLSTNQESGGGFKGLAIFAVCLFYAAVMFTLASVISAVIMLVGGHSKEKRKQLFVSGRGSLIMRSEFKKSVQLKTHQG